VNESFAAEYWPGRDPLDKHVRLVKERVPQSWLTVIGVIPDIHQDFHDPLAHDPLIYLPYALEPQRGTFIVARTRVPPRTLVKAFRHAVQSLDENLPVYDVHSLDDRIAQKRLDRGIFVALFTIFAGIALLLASVGLYAVVAHSVSQRTQEIGIRMALGADRGRITTMILREGMTSVVVGLVLGIAAALALSRLVSGLLFGVGPTDVYCYAGSAVVLLMAAAAACLLPARRATAVSPLTALRARIPFALDLDLWEERAWVGIVPFRMTNVAPRGVPALPGLSAFPEVNVRTYVRVADKPGVTTPAQLSAVRDVQRETGRRYLVVFGERLGTPAMLPFAPTFLAMPGVIPRSE
jgi:hypothetical protein